MKNAVENEGLPTMEQVDNAGMELEKKSRLVTGVRIMRQMMRVSVRVLDEKGRPKDKLEDLYRVERDIGIPVRLEMVDPNLCLRFEVQVLRNGVMGELCGEMRFSGEEGVKPRLAMTGYNGAWKSGEGYTPWSSERGEGIPLEEAESLLQSLYMDGRVLLETRMYLDYLLREAQENVLRKWSYKENEKMTEVLLKWDRVMYMIRQKEGWSEAVARANEVGCEVILEEFGKITPEWMLW